MTGYSAEASHRAGEVMARAAVFFAVMPYIGLIFLPSDVQPIAFAISALGLAVSPAHPSVPSILLPVSGMAVLATVSMVQQYVAGTSAPLLLLARSYYGYLAAPVIALFFTRFLRFLSSHTLARTLDFAVVVVYLGFVLNAVGATGVINLVVNRAVAGEFVGGARGFPSFFVEQSRVSEQMAFFFFSYLLVGELTRRRAGAVAVAALISGAGQVFVVAAHIALAYLLTLAVRTLVRLRFPASGMVGLGLVATVLVPVLLIPDVLLTLLLSLGFPSRGISAVATLSTLGLSYVAQDPGILLKVSGVLHAAATIMDNPAVFRMAAAADPQFPASIAAAYGDLSAYLFGSAVLVYPSRTYSALGTWVVDFGALGLLAAGSLLAVLVWRGVRVVAFTTRPLWAALFLAQVFFIKVALANPSLWILTALIWYATRSQGDMYVTDGEQLGGTTSGSRIVG